MRNQQEYNAQMAMNNMGNNSVGENNLLNDEKAPK